MAQNVENKFNESAEETNTKRIYDENDMKYLKDFQQIAFEKSEKWKLATDINDKLITVESRQGKYGVIISRASVIVDNKNLGTPEQLYSLLLNDWRMFHYISGESKISKKHTINKVKRIVEAVVAPKSAVAYPRNYLYYEIFALCDENGKIYTPHNLYNTRNCNKQRTLIAILKSVDKNNKKYYTKPENKSEVRGIFYRTGYALNYISENESKLVITLEYDMKGYNIVRSYGNAGTKCTELSFKMCQRLKKKLEFGVSFAHNITEEYNIAQKQIFELKKSLLQFKDWKLWAIDELIIWITGLENNKFEKYESILMKSLCDQQFNVCELHTINEHDLWVFGIKNFADRKCLIQHIQSLTKCEKKVSNMVLLIPAQKDTHNKCDIETDEVNAVMSVESSNSNYVENVEDEQLNNNQNEEEEEEINENETQLPPNWVLHKTNDGRVYYGNTVTNKTQWEVPK